MASRYTLFVLARIPAAALALGLAACGRGDPPKPTGTAKVEPKDPAAQPPSADPERAAKLEDLNTLCAALNHDYVDGTLSDYFADVSVKTEWGEAALAGGNDADRPGRFLEGKIRELSPDATDPALPACRELLDYIDEVE